MHKAKEQYFQLDEGYDKRVYENTFASYVNTVGVLGLFYFFNGLVTWGMFSFGMWNARAFTWWSIAIFGFGLVIFLVMLQSGSQANRKKRAADYLHAKISEKNAVILDEIERVK